MTLKKYIITVGGIVAVCIVAFFAYRAVQNRMNQQGGVPPAAETSSGSQSAVVPQASSSVSGLQVEGTGNYKIETLPISQSSKSQVAVLLNRPIVFPANFPQDIGKLMSDKINATAAELKKNPAQANEWLNLAIFRKQIDDFEGARQIWEFLAATNPKEPIPFANLANLYAFDLKDPAKAEDNFTKALEKGPKETIVYRQAYEFYRYVRKDDARAKDILRKGIAETSSLDIQYLLDHYAEL